MLRRGLRRCEKGATMVEFAFAAPILIVVMIGILQVAIALHAAGGVRNAIGEGARFAKVHRAASTGEVEAEVRKYFAGMDRAKIRTLLVQRGITAGGAPWARLTVAYEPQIVIPLLGSKRIRLQESRLVYLPA